LGEVKNFPGIGLHKKGRKKSGARVTVARHQIVLSSGKEEPPTESPSNWERRSGTQRLDEGEKKKGTLWGGDSTAFVFSRRNRKEDFTSH